MMGPILLSALALGATATHVDFEPSLFEPVEIRILESAPPRFVLVLAREMPTAGFRFEVDSVEVRPAERRIVASVTEVPPEGVAAQMISRTELRLDLGSLGPGRYFVEISSRRGRDSEHAPAGAMVVVAR
jgi:hypothetical protein